MVINTEMLISYLPAPVPDEVFPGGAVITIFESSLPMADSNFWRLLSSFIFITSSRFFRCSSIFSRYSFISGETSSALLELLLVLALTDDECDTSGDAANEDVVAIETDTVVTDVARGEAVT